MYAALCGVSQDRRRSATLLPLTIVLFLSRLFLMASRPSGHSKKGVLFCFIVFLLHESITAVYQQTEQQQAKASPLSGAPRPTPGGFPACTSAAQHCPTRTSHLCRVERERERGGGESTTQAAAQRERSTGEEGRGRREKKNN